MKTFDECEITENIQTESGDFTDVGMNSLKGLGKAERFAQM